jgi:hypothetical protein
MCGETGGVPAGMQCRAMVRVRVTFRSLLHPIPNSNPVNFDLIEHNTHHNSNPNPKV